ncbi:uncharacterized protein BXZ73DRAFT_53037 [Epithele typhae]|uniref:uncharacterized protein n=1 Tax=Epithele typhae TaxID=378194 RepID=UPI002007BF2D|nr:uncharacterized protein BXZ73DRAFT_53037 [Epithele typhae]KAH9918384.1 hypothetical protein BXZ73DRAFT_53037 [Epithele typhae]
MDVSLTSSEDDSSSETGNDWSFKRPPPSGVAWAPQAHLYAAARMDPVTMVQHLNDPFALEAAKQLAERTKTYLIYIDHSPTLPLGGIERWFHYEITAIAAAPPPPCEEENRGPEVSVPIFPNDTHPTGRIPLKTDPGPFPFPNCFHWPLKAMLIRVLPRPEGWNRDNAVRLPGDSEVLMGTYWENDQFRCRNPEGHHKLKEKLARYEKTLGKQFGAQIPFSLVPM